MTYLEVLTDIGSMMNDPNLNTYKDRAKDHFVRALSTLIMEGQYQPSDISGLYEMKRDLYLGDSLNENNLATHAKWDVTNDFTDTTAALRWLWSANQTSTAIQTAANRERAGFKSYMYLLTYRAETVTTPDGTFTLKLKTFSEEDISLPYSDGDHKVYFISSGTAPTDDFEIEAIATAGTEGEILIDNIFLQPAIPKDIMKLDAAFIDPANSSAPDVRVFVKDVGDIAKIGGNEDMMPSDDELFIYLYGTKIYPILSNNPTFDVDSDFISIAYVKNIDDSGWTDNTDFQSDTNYLFSSGFVRKATALAVQTLKEETARE